MKTSKARLPLLVPIALLAVVALASLPAPASASEWFLSGAPLSGSTELSATLTKPIAVSIPGAGIKVECPKATISKLVIFEKNKSQAEKITLEKCEAPEPSGCELVEREIKTEAIGLVPTLGAGKSVKLVKAPLHSTTVIVVSFGEHCGLASGSKVPLKGKVVTNAPTLQEEKLEQKVEFLGKSAEGLSAEIGKAEFPAFVTGELTEKVAAGEKAWSFH